MNRIGNLYEKIISLENLRLADIKAQKGKSEQPGVIAHNLQREANILKLHDMLLKKCYRTSAYTTFKIYEPKEREIFRLPYFPDRITHHAVMNVLEPIFISSFTADTYSCIRGKGIHGAKRAVENSLKDKTGAAQLLIDIELVPKSEFPFKTTIIEEDDRYIFS